MTTLPSENNTGGDSVPWIHPEFTSALVSIIVPTYNRADIIEETLESVWSQTYRPIELIIVNDGSKDNTKEIVTRWIELHNTDPEFMATYYEQDNGGAAAARNHGVKKSTGEFIQYLDSDDLIALTRVEKLVTLFNETGCEYIETGFDGFYKVRGDSEEKHYGHVGIDHIARLLQGMLWPNTLRAAFRRSLIVKTGPWTESIMFEDYEYAIRALVQMPKVKIEAIEEILASARRQGTRWSDTWKCREGRMWRIHCESVLCDRVKTCNYITLESKQALASRLYALGCRSNTKGWADLGKRCGELAENLGVELDALGRRRHLAFRLGKWGGVIYEFMGRIKGRMTFRKKGWRIEHVCDKRYLRVL